MRSAITGGPGTGKTTLVAALAECGLATFPEVARAILQAPGGMELRVQHPEGFANSMLIAERDAWGRAGSGPALFDRGFPDIVGFLNLEGLPVSDELDHCCRSLRYDGPIFWARPWQDIYEPDAERVQNWEEAVASDAVVCAAWRYYGYRLIELPFDSVSARVAFVMGCLATAGEGEFN